MEKNMSDDYVDILNKSWDDIPEPKMVPVGSFRLKGVNAKYMEAKDGDKNDALLFVYAPMEPQADVDPEELEELGDYDISQNRVFARFWLETANDWDGVRRHLAKHGIESGGRTIKETLAAFKGSEVIAYLDHRTFVNSVGETQIESDPKQFAPVDD
jgi:hypothetical protein